MTFLAHLSEIHTHYTPIKEIALDLMQYLLLQNNKWTLCWNIYIYIFFFFCIFCLKSVCQYQTCPLVALLCIFPFLAGKWHSKLTVKRLENYSTADIKGAGSCQIKSSLPKLGTLEDNTDPWAFTSSMSLLPFLCLLICACLGRCLLSGLQPPCTLTTRSPLLCSHPSSPRFSLSPSHMFLLLFSLIYYSRLMLSSSRL